MRKQFTEAFLKHYKQHDETMFMTGDLGYNALEPIREVLGERFINAGVAEQNMISVAAGLSYTGFVPWVYSIAPFLILKTVEQIRNDIACRKMNVKLVGNGGGFGYGIMGTTHHILEDIAIMTNMPNMLTYVPAFNEDIDTIVKKMFREKKPSYLRLGMAKPHNLKLPLYSGIREIYPKRNPKVVCISLGPLIHQVIPLIRDHREMSIWVVTELPIAVSHELLVQISRSKHTIILEECNQYGGLGQKIMSEMVHKGLDKKVKMTHLYARHTDNHRYGSQEWHLKANRLDTVSLLQVIHSTQS